MNPPTSELSAESLALTAEAVKSVAQANESRTRQLAELERITAWLQRELQTRAEQLERRDKELRAREAGAEDLARLQAALWPKALQTPPWSAWRARVMARAENEGPSALLLARLHTLAAYEQAGRTAPMETLRELGRALYETFAEEAPQVALSLTQAANGQFELRTIRIGDRVDNKLMKTASPGLTTVRSVSGWAVRDAGGIWQFLAEVS